jgi:hypothetical protein
MTAFKEHDAMTRPDDNPMRRLAALIERLGKAVNDGKETECAMMI